MGSIRISSDIPGPRSRSLTAAAPAWVARPVAPDHESVVIARGEGAVVEDVVKIARAVTRRPGIVCFEGAFHGRTNLTLALTHREVPYKQGFGPFAPEVYRLPYPGFEAGTMESFEKAAREVFATHDIAA